MQYIQSIFSNIVHQIIGNELNEIQQQEYLIEGEEIIKSLFSINALPSYSNEKDLAFDFGISPSGVDLQTAGIGFIEIINNCFYLIKELPAAKDENIWKNILQKNNTDPLLIDLLCTKYKDQLYQLVNSL